MRHRNSLWLGLIAVGLIAVTLVYTNFFASAQGNVRIRYGETAEGEIATAGEVDRWEFNGTQGDVITIEIERTGGDLIPSVTLIGPDGSLIIGLDWPVDGPPEVLLTASLRTTGLHILAIDGTTSDVGTNGPYTLRLELQEAGIQEEGILAYGRMVSGEINDTTFRDFWTFRGTRGDVVDVMMRTTGGNLDTYLSLVSPQGDVVVSSDAGGTGTDAALFAVTLPSSGNYSVSARRSGGNFGEDGTTQGTYELVVTLRRPGSEDSVPTPTTLSLGMETRGRLNADAPTALFSVDASGVLAIALDVTDQTQLCTLTVMTPNGALLNTVSGVTPIRASVTLPNPGTYWIEVSAIGIQQDLPTDFEINFEQLATVHRAARPLLYNRPQRVTPSSIQPEAWYFHGKTGDLVEIAITPFHPILDSSSMQIIAPDGVVIATRPLRTVTTQSLLLADSGVYEIVLNTAALSDGYQIVVNHMGMRGFAFAQYTVPQSQGILTEIGAVSGELGASSTDAWIIDVTQAQPWQFVLNQFGSNEPVTLAIEAPDGKLLAIATTDRLTNSATLQVTLPHIGRYRALVFDPTHETSHTYTLQGTSGEGGQLVAGSRMKGVLTGSVPADRWEMQISPNTLLNVSLTILAGTGTPTIHVMGPDGLLIATNASGEQRDSLALVGVPVKDGGRFEILVRQPSNGERLVYVIEAHGVAPFAATATVTPATVLQVEEVFTTDTLVRASSSTSSVRISDQITPRIQLDAEFMSAAGPIDLETLVRGEVGIDQLYQAWRLTVNADQVIGFSVVALEDTSGPDLSVLNAEGTILAETFQNHSTSTYMMHRFIESGTYTLVVKLDQGGRYTLFADVLPEIDETVPQILPGHTIAYGETVQGEIIQPDDFQTYIFFGKAGDVISARALRTQGDTNLKLSLMAVNGTPLRDAAMITSPPFTEITGFVLPDDALYQLTVTHDGDDAGIAGRFALSLAVTETAASQRGGGVLGNSRIASLDANDPAHRWIFAGQAGERVTVLLEPLADGTPSPLTLQLADSAGHIFLQKESLIGQSALGFEQVLLPRVGVYQAIVSGGRTPGTYRITLDRDLRYTQDGEYTIRYGETSGKVLTSDNFLDVWTFAGTKGDVITTVVRPARGDKPALSLQLRAQNGLVLGTSAGDNTGSRLEHITLPDDGHYSLIIGNVDGTFEGAAAYEITLLLEDTAARSMGTVIDYGQVVEGYFFLDDAVDTWLFEGQQGDVIRTTVTSSSQNLHPTIELVSTDWRAASTAGQVTILSSVQGAENLPATLEFVLPAAGPYALTVRDQALVGGPYTLELNSLTPTAALPSTIRYDQSRNGQLGAIHVADSWQFEGTAGEAVTITVEPDTRSQLAPKLLLMSVDDQVLVSTSARSGGIAQIDAYPLTKSGLYTIIVSRYLDTAGYTEGRYILSLRRSVFDARNYPAITYGSIQSSRLSEDNAQDTWILAGSQPGDVVRIYVEATSGDLDPVLRVYNTQGDLIGSADDGPGLNAELFVPVFEEGSYYIDVRRYGNAKGVTEGNYALTVDVAYQGKPEISEYILTYGDRVAGSVDGNAGSDFWGFIGEQGDTLRAKIQFPRDDAPLALYLHDPAGEELAVSERDRGDSVISSFTLPYSGYYTLEVRRPGDARAVYSPYTLELTLLSVAKAEMNIQGGIITPDQPVTALFTSGPGSHTWIFEGSAQTPISLTLNRLDGVLPQHMTVYGPDGMILFADHAPSGTANVLSTGTVHLPNDGMYTLIITGEKAVMGSAYRLTLREKLSDKPLSQQIAPLEDGFGAITNINPFENWTFVAEAGDMITVRVSVLAGDLEPTLIIWGPDRLPLAEGIRETSVDKQVVIWGLVAPISGSYGVTVGRTGGRMGATSGEYRLMLRPGPISSQAARARDIALNTQIAQYTAGKSTAYYAFQGVENDVVGISVHLTEAGALPDVTLETEAGAELHAPLIVSENEVYIPAFALPAAGRYIVRLDSRATVGYELSIFQRDLFIAENAVTRSLGRNSVFIEGVLDSARPTYWQFSGQAGDVLTFTVDTTGGGLRADVTLYGPGGYIANAVEQPGPSVTLGPVRLSTAGDYVLLVGPWLGSLGGSTGQYSLRMDNAESGVSGSNGGHIMMPGYTVTGGFIAGDTQDTWTFDGQAENVVTIQAEQLFGEGSISLELVGPDGQALISSIPATNYLGSEISEFMLPTDGVYTVIAGGRLIGAGAIEYRLALSQQIHFVNDEAKLKISSTGILAIPSIEAQYGQVTVTEPVQSWTLTPTHTGTYLITVQPFVVDVVLDVFIMSAGEVENIGSVGAQGCTCTFVRLTEGDEYTVLVSGGPELAQGRYAIQAIPASAVMPGKVIAPSERNVGRIDSDMLHNEWRVQGQAETTLILEITPITGTLIPRVTFVGPDGAILQTIEGVNGTSTMTFQVPADGIYGFEISRIGSTSGDYALVLGEE